MAFLRKMQSCCLSFLVLIIIKLCGFYYVGTLQTKFMVDMKCEGCVNSVKNKLQTVDEVKNVEVDLGNQVVRVLSSSPVKIMTEALE
ncbi:copper chaperone for superoxide dismutase, chloroplastic/cytosolic-like [Mercurialis annua]|uniref:copper chaperone for superoxide dismutase, chloroplastic/cytosolic-like n=1 Tax=Mercurialis annua TaxID=3986 RepID=UPI00215ECBE3|nr:copper chaperone for superoxide dismutase, chloroplastic/cytosolic-like [Mercurialis annua]